MTPTMEEVAGWLREAATECEDFRDWLESTGHTALASDKEDQGILFRSRASQVEAMGWRPIEEAPKDGTVVDLWDSGSEKRLTDCRWDGNNRWIRLEENAFGVMAWCVVKGKITRFMLQPQPPVKE